MSVTKYITRYLCFYRPQRSCGQGNIFTPVCHSVHRGGFLPQCMLGYQPPRTTQNPPPGTTPPGPHPPGTTPPRTRHPPVPDPPPPRTRPPPPGTTPPYPWDHTTPWNQTPTPPGPHHPPRTRAPSPGPDPPPRDQVPPGSGLQHTFYERPVRILLECILIIFLFRKRIF